MTYRPSTTPTEVGDEGRPMSKRKVRTFTETMKRWEDDPSTMPITARMSVFRAKLQSAGVSEELLKEARDIEHEVERQLRDPEMWLPEEMEVISKPCSVTAYNMMFYVHTDGRQRGLWFRLQDDERNPKVGEAALLEWPAIKAVYKAIGGKIPK